MPPRLWLSPAFERRLARTPLRRHLPTIISSPSPLPLSLSHRSFSTSSPLSAKKDRYKPRRIDKEPRSVPPLPPIDVEALNLPTQPPDSALAVLLSRLTLSPDPSLYPSILACLTHPSYANSPYKNATASTSSSSNIEYNNEVLASTGNSLLGLFASEFVADRFPFLPTEPLKSAVTAYVGPSACAAVARELGIGVKSGADAGEFAAGEPSSSAGVPIRWERMTLEHRDAMVYPGARFNKMLLRRKWAMEVLAREKGEPIEGEEEAVPRIDDGRVAMVTQGMDGSDSVGSGGFALDPDHSRRVKYNEKWVEVVGSVVKAFVGLIYEQKGLHEARAFVHAHFFSRHLDFTTLFNFKSPKNVLTSVVARHLAEAGINKASGMATIEARLLASTGVATMAPLFNIGLFLPSGLKLAEGTGSSKAMAEHRAAVNALMSLYLVRGDVQRSTSGRSMDMLPTMVHAHYPLNKDGLSIEEVERSYRGRGFGGLESNVENSKRAQRRGRLDA